MDSRLLTEIKQCAPFGLPNSLRHLHYVFEGYRARVSGEYESEDESPYSPGGARDISWRGGYRQAITDAEAAVKLNKEQG